MSTFATPFEKRVYDKFIEKTDYCTRSKYRENTIYREALISLEIIHDELSRQRQGARDVLEGSYLLVVTDKI